VQYCLYLKKIKKLKTVGMAKLKGMIIIENKGPASEHQINRAREVA
jgi:hypothetical protein